MLGLPRSLAPVHFRSFATGEHLGSGLSLAGYGMVWVKDIFMTLHAAHPHRESVHVRHVHGCHVSCMRGADIQVPPWEVPAPTPSMPDHGACYHHPYPPGGAAEGQERSLMWVRLRRIYRDGRGKSAHATSVSQSPRSHAQERQTLTPAPPGMAGPSAVAYSPPAGPPFHPARCTRGNLPIPRHTEAPVRAPAHQGGLHLTHML